MKFFRLSATCISPDGYLLSRAIMATVLLAGLMLSVTSYTGQANGLYKWVDENGQVRYSDRLPPSQIKQGHQQLNSQGIVIDSQQRALTEEEKEAARQAEIEEQKRLAEEAESLAEEARQAAIQRDKDKVLLLTFSSERELTEVFKDRAEVINSVIALIEKSITTTEEQLTGLQKRADEAYISQGREVPGGLAQRIEEAIRKIEIRQQQLTLKQAEKDKVMQTFERDLERFRLLHQGDEN